MSHMNVATAQEQQDVAAGGREMRELRLDDGSVVTVSVELLKRGHQIWGYIRFKSGATTTRKYVGRVTAETREESLRLCWNLVRRIRVVDEFGWQWIVKGPKVKR